MAGAMARKGCCFLGLLLVACSSGGGVTASSQPTSVPITNSPSPSPSLQIPPIPDGTYEVTVTRADASRLGFVRCDPQDVDENIGHVVMTLRGGRYRQVMSANHPIAQPVSTGVYKGTATMVTFIYNPHAADEGTTAARWGFDGKYLHFEVLKATDAGGQPLPLCIARLGLEAHPWLKTG